MNLCLRLSLLLASFLAIPRPALGEIVIHHERLEDNRPSSPFHFRHDHIPAPSRQDAASRGTFTLVEGRADPNSGGLKALNDDALPLTPDQPRANFFFTPNSEGGRLQLDLGSIRELAVLNTYSWHPAERGPQVYTLYASDGQHPQFDPLPKRPVDPASVGWKKLADVDTRVKADEPGGQFGVSIAAREGSLGAYRYLLFDVRRTGLHSSFDQTFFSEVDVHAQGDPIEPVPAPELVRFEVQGPEGSHRYAFDLTAAPDLEAVVRERLVPVVTNWYPKIVALLPSENFQAPTEVTIQFRQGMGGIPASASGSRVNCNADWFRRNIRGEAIGSVVHELVHVVQQYRGGRRRDPGAARPPGWLVEGIPDYIRWFLYEPETRGAEITRANLDRARHDASYRITGNFLHWVTQTHDREIVRKLNAAAREGRYREDLWKECTGKTLDALGQEWREAHRQRLGVDGTDRPDGE